MNPARLPPGTQVGPWRVVDRRGIGTYGAVYLAVDIEHDAPSPVALKLALYPRDTRFPREEELLSRIHHPAVPRLWGSGHWKDAKGTRYPYLAMEWVEGMSLYAWAHSNPPTSRQALKLLAVLARALEATHVAGGVHRDVKGDNVLVRHSDGRVFLTDFGSGHFLGAATLTPPPFPPGTPNYRSPEAWRHVLRRQGDMSVPYAPGPADDVFALGVTAYHLVTEEYPVSVDATDEASRRWYLEGIPPLSPRARNSRCSEELSALVSRMIAIEPEARGSAGELAVALERAARGAGPDADVPLFVRQELARGGVQPTLRPQGEHWRPRLAAASLGAAFALGVAWMQSRPTKEEPTELHALAQEESRDGGTVAVGDSVLTAPVAPERAPFAWSSIALEIPPNPIPGQRRADSSGRCPGSMQIPINGGCWRKVPPTDQKKCDEDTYLYKGACYMPVLSPPRPATSRPGSHDGGQ
ncbi:serine/threonine protein kinase [Pyxidicoccus xibeiensis]|uniref:serine/threonine protein kinase n=1 Tax=Pyxidicoccus xibeiensis TaxID=2906759 RepID=UPI0020A82FAA|nr:serine/threonine-protein kinase [Pyxidicoccus xibeiensis]MCP3142827.1 serine/threonine protein kinase [Pyxidicoccus xibeiensis]